MINYQLMIHINIDYIHMININVVHTSPGTSPSIQRTDL